MFPRFRSPLSALALCAVLSLGALGAAATPARADGRDAAAVLGGIIALYAIGRALDQRNDRDPPSQYYLAPGHPAPQYHAPPRPQHRVAPAHCYREFQTRNGYFRGYAGDCLQRSVRHGLPDACAREFRTNHGRRIFYGGRCMAQNGWQHEGDRRFH